MGDDYDEGEPKSGDSIGFDEWPRPPLTTSEGSWGIETRRQRAELETALFGEPEAPVCVGRYTIIGTLGAGGMGIVYVARDEQLDRRVALKLLRRSDDDDEASVRLQREAMAMARLSHPNVVTVHEVGRYQEQIFVAMEFVSGTNLRAWLAAEPRGWREVVAAFVQAGEGLAAAHGAGLVHRDFKPDNVLFGDDGRVRVADFGLAHAMDAAAEEVATLAPDVSDETISAISLDVQLTKTGSLLGTPAYMAPEQFGGGRGDTRSDQFSFCVALWEGLYGRRPFAAPNFVALSQKIMSGAVDEPGEGGPEVPAWLRAVVLRGLSADPDQRWPSMRALLDALARDPVVIRRRRLRVGGVVALALAGLIASGVLAGARLRSSARQRYWNDFMEQLLDLERERGLRQATRDARRARDATRMSGYRRYRPREGVIDREDPTIAAMLLREVEGEARAGERWVSAANEILGRPLSYAVLDGHRDVIIDIAFTPDAQTVYTASHDGEVRRWSVREGVGEVIISHAREITGMAVSADGQLVASVAKDRQARLWDAFDRQPARVVAEHGDELFAVALDPSGRMLATGSKDGVIKLTRISTGEVRELAGHGAHVHDLEFDAKGERLVSASRDHSVMVWRVRDGARLASFEGHERAVFHARFAGEDEVVSASDDGTVRRWSLGRGGAAILTRHADAIAALDLYGDRVASASIDGEVRVYGLFDAAPAKVLAADGPEVWTLSFAGEGEAVAGGSFDANARLWPSDGAASPEVFRGHAQAVLRVEVDPSGRWLATGAYDGQLRLWDLERPRLQQRLDGHRAQVAEIAFDAAEQRVATASHDGSVRLWSVDSGRELAALRGGQGSVYSLAFSPDDSLIAAGAESGAVLLWPTGGGEARVLEGHGDRVWDLAFDASGRRLASASFDEQARVWDVSSGELLLTLDGHGGHVNAIDWESPRESGGLGRIITASEDGALRLWDPDSGVLVAVFGGHAGRILSLARSPDGQTLATASEDGSVRLWPDADAAHALALRGHRKPVWSVAFDAAGERVVSASYDGDARVWSVADGALLATLSGHSEGLWGARFLADGRVVTISEDNSIRVWTLDGEASAIVLSAHQDAVTSFAVDREGRRMISGSGDGVARLWRLDLLRSDPSELAQALRDATISCLKVDQRVRELGEEPREAELGYAKCEAAHGR
nr:serine/threonine-protein kinase [Pseudenhygromyxa sp. WMMC2535]